MHPEMSEAFTASRLKSHPLMGTWSIAGAAEEYPGFLYLDGDELNLTIYLTIAPETPAEIIARADPRLLPFAPPNRPTICGQTKHGRVTLFDCAQINSQAAARFIPPQARVELTLRPMQAWIGGDFVKAEGPYQELRLEIPGLHNILATLHIDHHFLVETKGRRKSPTHKLKKLTGANEAFLVYELTRPQAKVSRGGKSYTVHFVSDVSQSSSSTEGITIKTSDLVIIRSKGASLIELINVASEVERFLCLLCIGPVRGEHVTVKLDEFKSAELLAALGRPLEPTAFELLPHQTLVLLGAQPDLAQKALQKWFAGNEATRIARWLFGQALFARSSSTARFLSVAQAWEIMGREESKTTPYDKKKFSRVCKEINKLVTAELGEDAAERLIGLISSSNRDSFPTLSQNIIREIPKVALDKICGDLTQFVAATKNVRNVLTHMEGKKKMPLDMADRLSMFLTFKLLVLFCIHSCAALGLPLDNLEMMLDSNPMARWASRPLPGV
jgi:hypothetical protein